MEIGKNQYLYVNQLMDEVTYHLNPIFEINSRVKVKPLYARLVKNHDLESIYFIDVIERSPWDSATKYYIKDVNMKRMDIYYFNDELILTSEIRANKIIKCKIRGIKYIDNIKIIVSHGKECM